VGTPFFPQEKSHLSHSLPHCHALSFLSDPSFRPRSKNPFFFFFPPLNYSIGWQSVVPPLSTKSRFHCPLSTVLFLPPLSICYFRRFNPEAIGMVAPFLQDKFLCGFLPMSFPPLSDSCLFLAGEQFRSRRKSHPLRPVFEVWLGRIRSLLFSLFF